MFKWNCLWFPQDLSSKMNISCPNMSWPDELNFVEFITVETPVCCEVNWCGTGPAGSVLVTYTAHHAWPYCNMQTLKTRQCHMFTFLCSYKQCVMYTFSVQSLPE